MSGSSQGTLWLRKLSLLVGVGGGNALDLSAFRVVFQVRHGTIATPLLASFRVYNLSDNTVQQIRSQEHQRVILQAGYETGQFGVIFDGTIAQSRSGRENPTDTFVDLFALNDIYHNFAVMNQTLAAGYTQTDMYGKIQQSFGEYDVQPGDTPDMLNSQSMPRGRTMYGMTRDHMRNLTRSNNATWYVHQKTLHTIPIKPEGAANAAVVLNSQTGMIGIPTQTLDGIVVRSLLNANIGPGTVVQINQRDIIRAQLPQDFASRQDVVSGANFDPQGPMYPKVTTDGFYRVWFVDHIGDTRGQNWYSDFVAQSVDQSAQVVQGAAAESVPQPPV